MKTRFIATIRHVLVCGGIGAMAAYGLPVQAQTGSHDHHAAPAAVKVAGADMTEGEVRKVDKEKKTITLKHGAIKNLDMPPMTMVFQVKDPAMLAAVKAGDKVRFAAANPGGKLTVTEIEPAK